MTNANTKTPLVLLAGLLCDKFMWSEIAERLDHIADVSIFSFSGFNSISDMADHVLEKSPKKFSLVGHSLGGRVALEIYRKNPERIEKLGLFNTGVHPRRDSEIPGRQRLLDLSIKEGMEAVADTWLPPMMSPKGLNNPQLMAELKAMVLRHTAEDFNGEIQALLNRPDAEAVLPLINIPTLLLSGTEDSWSPISQHAEIQQQVTGSTLVELPDVGHMSVVEDPYKIAQILENWLIV
jgi:pimeloyl-ACP methyl ester carboxylesterase